MLQVEMGQMLVVLVLAHWHCPYNSSCQDTIEISSGIIHLWLKYKIEIKIPFDFSAYNTVPPNLQNSFNFIWGYPSHQIYGNKNKFLQTRVKSTVSKDKE